MDKEYHKIKTLYERDVYGNKKLIEGKFISPTFEYLKDNVWEFTEKVDGTNIRVYWDGHKVSFHGRTDKAQIPSSLLNKLVDLFGDQKNEELFEQLFGDKEVTLYGEGYGIGIQKVGCDYLDHQDFILFDVNVNGFWLNREDIESIAAAFNIKIVPVVFEGTLKEGVDFVKSHPKSLLGSCEMEGVVGRTKECLYDRNGDRMIVKIKVRDFL